MNIEKQTIKLWGGFISLVALILAAGQFNLLPFALTVGFWNAVFLWLLGATVFIEIAMKDRKFRIKDAGDMLATIIALFVFVLGLFTLGMPVIPSTMSGAIGSIYIVLAIVVIYVIYK